MVNTEALQAKINLSPTRIYGPLLRWACDTCDVVFYYLNRVFLPVRARKSLIVMEHWDLVKNGEKWPFLGVPGEGGPGGPPGGPRGAPGGAKSAIRGLRGPGLWSGICPIL